MNMLEKIISHKGQELKQLNHPVRYECLPKKPPFARIDFQQAIASGGTISIIGEIKKQSPSHGVLRNNFNPALIAKEFGANGIRAISVLTDHVFFGGKLEDLRLVKQVATLPVLRKDFIIDERQIYESFSAGADALLLIARILEKSQLNHFIDLSHALGMACLIEVHDLLDLKKALNTNARIIGVNNRDLDSLKVDIQRATALRPKIPQGYTTVCESGIKNRVHVRMMEDAGFDALLIGETLMQADSISNKIKELTCDTKIPA